jgi:hypothetical protein
MEQYVGMFLLLPISDNKTYPHLSNVENNTTSPTRTYQISRSFHETKRDPGYFLDENGLAGLASVDIPAITS